MDNTKIISSGIQNCENTPSICVVCLTYNHEKFLKNALDSFISQKVNYPFRVIVHDDASTDKTTEIMLEYEKKYPELFTMIYEKENQFSKLNGIGGIYREIIAPLVHEKYVALCEGDDYWTDPLKIQIQADYMEKNSDCPMCVHDTMLVDPDGNNIKRLNGSDNEQFYNMKNVLFDWGNCFHTTSFFCRREIIFERPREFYMNWVDDWALSIYAASIGKISYIGRVMSCFRCQNSESQTSKSGKDLSIKINHFIDAIDSWERMNEYTNKKFNELFTKKIASFEAWLLIYQKKYLKAFLKYPYYSLKHFIVKILWKLKMI